MIIRRCIYVGCDNFTLTNIFEFIQPWFCNKTAKYCTFLCPLHSICRSDGFCSYLAAIIINTLRPRQNGCHFADDNFKYIFMNENVWIQIENSLKFVPKGQINNIPALVQIMACRRPGDKPLSEPMMFSLPTHICVTRPQWVNRSGCFAWCIFFPGQGYVHETWTFYITLVDSGNGFSIFGLPQSILTELLLSHC